MSDSTLQTLVELFSHDPAIVIYLMLAATYAFAAFMWRHTGHNPFAGVYMVSSILHVMLCACHFIGQA